MTLVSGLFSHTVQTTCPPKSQYLQHYSLTCPACSECFSTFAPKNLFGLGRDCCTILPVNILQCCQTEKTQRAELFLTVRAMQLLPGCVTSLQGREEQGCSSRSVLHQPKRKLLLQGPGLGSYWFHKDNK